MRMDGKETYNWFNLKETIIKPFSVEVQQFTQTERQ